MLLRQILMMLNCEVGLQFKLRSYRLFLLCKPRAFQISFELRSCKIFFYFFLINLLCTVFLLRRPRRVGQQQLLMVRYSTYLAGREVRRLVVVRQVHLLKVVVRFVGLLRLQVLPRHGLFVIEKQSVVLLELLIVGAAFVVGLGNIAHIDCLKLNLYNQINSLKKGLVRQ